MIKVKLLVTVSALLTLQALEVSAAQINVQDNPRQAAATANNIRAALGEKAGAPHGAPGQAEATAILNDLNAGGYAAFGNNRMQALEAQRDYNARVAPRPGGGPGGGHGGGPGGGHGGGMPLPVVHFVKPPAMDLGVFNAINGVPAFGGLSGAEKQAIVDSIQHAYPHLPANPPLPGRTASLTHHISLIGAYSVPVAAPIAAAIDWAFPDPLAKPGTMDQVLFDTIRNTAGFAALHESHKQAIVDAIHHAYPALPLPLLPGRTALVRNVLNGVPLPIPANPHAVINPVLAAAIVAAIDLRFPAIVNPGLPPGLFAAITNLPGFKAAGVKQLPLLTAIHALVPAQPFGPGRDLRIKEAVKDNGGSVAFGNTVVTAVNGPTGYPHAAWVPQVLAPNGQGADAEAELNANLVLINPPVVGAPVGGFTAAMINEIAYAVESTEGPFNPGGARTTTATRKPEIRKVICRLAGINPVPLIAQPGPAALAAIEKIISRVTDYVKPPQMPNALFLKIKGLDRFKNLPSYSIRNNVLTAVEGIIHPGPIPVFGPARDNAIRLAVVGAPGVPLAVGPMLATQIKDKFNLHYPRPVPVIAAPGAGGNGGLAITNAIIAAAVGASPSFNNYAHQAGHAVNALVGGATAIQKVTTAMDILQNGDPAVLPVLLPPQVPPLSAENQKAIKAAVWLVLINEALHPSGLAGAGGLAPAPGHGLLVANVINGHVVASGTITQATAYKVGNAIHALSTADPAILRQTLIDISMIIIDAEQPALVAAAAIDPLRGGDPTIPGTIKGLIAGAIPVPVIPAPVPLTAVGLGMDAGVFAAIHADANFMALADVNQQNAVLTAVQVVLGGPGSPVPAVNNVLNTTIENAIKGVVWGTAPVKARTLRKAITDEIQGIDSAALLALLRADVAVLNNGFLGNNARRDAVLNHFVPLLSAARAHKHHSVARTNAITAWINSTPGLAPAPTHAEINTILAAIDRAYP